MVEVKKTAALLFIFSLFAVVACSPTRMMAVWKDKNYTGTPSNILILGISEQETRRRFFEDEFVRQLEAAGTQAVASYTIFPKNKMLAKEDILPKIKGRNIDAVLITRLVDKEKIKTRISRDRYTLPPRYYHGWHRLYREGYEYERTRIIQERTSLQLTLETSLYDAASEQLIWSGLSETFASHWDSGTTRAFIKEIIGQMRKDGVVP